MLTKAVTAAEAQVLAQRLIITDDGALVWLICPQFHKQHQAIVSLADD
ncbi:MAG: hypothetical protein KGZ60_03530 [Truepera sp.]|nr:hypothetical protein [Truepera sp.]